MRESTSIERVAEILEALGDEVEVVPLDVFLKMAASAKDLPDQLPEGYRPGGPQ